MTWTRKEADERRAAILSALKAAGGNVTRTADALGCSRPTLYKHATMLGLQREFGLRDEDAQKVAEGPINPDTRRTITVKIPETLWRWARIEGINRTWTVSAVVELALERLRAGPGKGAA